MNGIRAFAAVAALTLCAAGHVRSDDDMISQFEAHLDWPAQIVRFELTIAEDANTTIQGLRWAMRTGSPISAENWDDEGTMPLPDPTFPETRPGEKIDWTLAIDASTFDRFPSGGTVYFAVILSPKIGDEAGISDPNASVTVPADGIPPAGTDALEAIRQTPGSIRLRWPTPGDDGLLGTATRYIVLSSSRPLTAADFETPGIDVEEVVTPAPGNPLVSGWEMISLVEPVPAAGGALPGQHFALMTEDEAGNRSPLSNDAFLPSLVPPGPTDHGDEAEAARCAALPLGGSLAVLAALLLLPNFRRSARG